MKVNEIRESEVEQFVLDYARRLKCPVVTPLEITWKLFHPFSNDTHGVYYRPVLRVMNSMVARGLLNKTMLSNNVSVYWLPEREKQP